MRKGLYHRTQTQYHKNVRIVFNRARQIWTAELGLSFELQFCRHVKAKSRVLTLRLMSVLPNYIPNPPKYLGFGARALSIVSISTIRAGSLRALVEEYLRAIAVAN